MKKIIIPLTILLALSLGWSGINNPESFKIQPTFKKGHAPDTEGRKWKIVDELSDEFDATEVNLDKWQVEPYGNDWVWIGRPPALFRKENISLKDDKLCVTVGKLDSTRIINDKTFTHEGGLVRSLVPGKVGMYFECKMKANKTVMSSTFWLMTKYDCHKKLETDIQECVGRTTELTEDWAQGWDSIYHSNAIHRPTECVEKLQLQDFKKLAIPNHERYYIYAAWWKSPEEIQFFLDGEYQYSIHPEVEWDMPAFIHMAIETYSWNPIPEDGGLVEKGTWDERTTQYEWVRTWELQ